MQVLIVRNPSSRVKGLLRQVGLEVEPNVFVTSLTQDRALEVFEEVQYRGEEIPGFRVILIQEETGLPGYSVRGSGENLLETSSLDGLTFRSRKKKSSQTSSEGET